MPDDLGERTEQATPRRLRQARADGQVARSHDLGAAIALLLATLAAWFAAGTMLSEGRGLLERALTFSLFEEGLAPSTMWVFVDDVLMSAAWVFIPLVLVLALASILSQFVQVGWLFTLSPLKPRASRINPVDGTKRLLGSSGAVRVTLDLLKIGAVLLVAVLTMLQYASGLLTLPYLDLPTGMEQVGMCLLDLALRVGGVLLLLGFVDLAWQRWKYKQDLKMTRQQVRDELRDAEGDPEVRRRRRQRALQDAGEEHVDVSARVRILLVAPGPVAVLIEHDRADSSSPMVLAAARGDAARLLQQEAADASTPIVETGSLASELHEQVASGERIPEHLFRGVAEVLAGMYRDSGNGTP